MCSFIIVDHGQSDLLAKVYGDVLRHYGVMGTMVKGRIGSARVTFTDHCYVDVFGYTLRSENASSIDDASSEGYSAEVDSQDR